MKEKLAALKIEYRTNPGWCWLLAILFLFPLLPEYVSPFILFAGFIVFKVQWSREGRKAKVGTIGKMMMLFMGYALLSTLWSPTSFSTFSTAALWWGMFLLQVMIYNLARSRDKIDALLQTCTASACALVQCSFRSRSASSLQPEKAFSPIAGGFKLGRATYSSDQSLLNA